MKVDNINNAWKNTQKAPPATESQLELIEELKAKVEANGIDISFLAEPTDSKIASAVLRSLIRICKNNGL